jgi:uncharacterized DUF497 family protein
VVYEWDSQKADANARKHGVPFNEALTVFRDPLALTFDDPDHSTDERHFITIGVSDRNRILFVAHVERGFDRIRIISARKATRRETYAYQESHD